MIMITGNEPAMPCEVGYDEGEMQQSHQNGNTTALFNGLTKREYFAVKAMEGLLSIYANDGNPSIVPNYENVKYMAGLSVVAADALIAELNKTEN